MGALKTIATALGGAFAVVLLIELLPTGRGSVSTSSTATAPSAVIINDRGAAELAALRREVRASAHPVRVVAAVPRVDDDLPAPTAEQVDAAETAMNVIANAADAGRWTTDDRDRLHQVIDRLHPDDREAVLLAWAAAVNEQRLRPDVPML